MVEERWHDFAKEKPSEDMEGRNFIVSNGHYEKIATWCGYWENEPFMGDRLCDEVVRWKFYFTPEEEKANEATRTEPNPMKCDELKSLWVYSRDINENCDEEFVNFAKENGYEELVEKKEVTKAIAELKNKLEDAKATAYAEMVDAGMRERRLRRALWIARAERAKEHLWHDVKPDGSPKEDYEGKDWVLVQLREVGGIELIPRVAEYRRHVKRWVFIDEDYDTENSHEFRYLRDKCIVIGWRDIDFAYYGKKFFVQQEINNNVERKCREKAEEYK